jgi:hypothetical protein
MEAHFITYVIGNAKPVPNFLFGVRKFFFRIVVIYLFVELEL